MQVFAEVIVQAPKDIVWKIISDIPNLPNYMKGIEKIEIAEPRSPGLLGLRWTETRLYFGKSASIDKWITKLEVGEMYETRSEMDGFVFLTRFTLAETPQGLSLKSMHETQALDFMSRLKMLPMFFFKGMLRKAIIADLMDLKAACER